MRGPREILNELLWREGALGEAEIHYVHRGAPGDARVASGADVEALGRSFLTLRDGRRVASIPYHRVFLIERRGRRVWERRSGPSADADPGAGGGLGHKKT